MTNTQNEPVEVTEADAIKFLESALRNWAHVSFDKDDLEDVRAELQAFARRAKLERDRLSASSAVVDALREDFCRSNVETWHQEWVNAKGGQWGDNIAWASALQIADRLDAALANTPKPNAGLVEDIEVLRKLAKEARDAEANCNRVIELLTPEWERFEKRDGSHNTYASRLYADHTSHARTNKRDADALERILSALEGDRP